MYNYEISPAFIILLFDDTNDPEISDILSEMSHSDNYVSLEGQVFYIENIELMNVGLILFTQGERINDRQKCNAV